MTKTPYRDLELKRKCVEEFIPEHLTQDCYTLNNTEFKQHAKERKITIERKYVPGKTLFLPPDRTSSLTPVEQMQCLNALILQQTRKQDVSNKNSVLLYNNLLPKILEENKKFQIYAKINWENRKCNQFTLKRWLRKYLMAYYSNKLLQRLNYPKHYNKTSLLSIYNDSIKVEIQHIQNVLQLGTLGKFQHPNLNTKFVFKKETLPSLTTGKDLSFKQVVSQDKNIDRLLESCEVDFVISSSGLKTLLNYKIDSDSWHIPIVVKEVIVSIGDKKVKKNVIFLDKSIIKDTLTPTDLSDKGHKILLQTNFCKFEAFKFENEEESVTENKQTKGTSKMYEGTIYHNVSYNTWELKEVDEECSELLKTKSKVTPIRLLVRTKLQACEMEESGQLRPVIVVPKMEYQLQFGARFPSLQELSKYWTSLFFRPFSNLYRVEMDSFTSEIVRVEKCDLTSIKSEALKQSYNVQQGLKVLYIVLNSLRLLKPGNYLLVHAPKHEHFAELLEEGTENDAGSFNLHDQYDDVKIKNYDKKDIPWWPINTNAVLPAHIEQNQLPGTFKGFIRTKKSKKRKRKSK